MCLSVISDEVKEKYKGRKTAYKLFCYVHGERYQPIGLKGICYGGVVLPRGKWLNEADFREDKEIGTIETGGYEAIYPVGWHCYPNKDDASSCTLFYNELIRVKVRGLLEGGYEGNSHPVLIYKEIFIPKEGVNE